MKISLILAHPDPYSFNHAIAAAAASVLRRSRHIVAFHDLYQEKFNPLLSSVEISSEARVGPILQRYCAEIAAADGIIIVHPNWWGQPPAVLKGWVDRVIRAGVAYEFLEGDNGEGIPRGLLKARAALVFNTSNTPCEREMAVFGDPLENLWKNCIFGLCGVKTFYRKNFGVIVTSTPEQRQQWLAEAAELTNRCFPK